MSKDDLLSLFCEATIYPKYIQLSPFHDFLGLGMAEQKEKLETGHEYLIHLHSFANDFSSPWEGFSNLTYLPAIVYVDGSCLNYQDPIIEKTPSIIAPWIIESLPPSPSFSEWIQMIQVFKESSLDKVVLGCMQEAVIVKRSSLLALLQPLLHLKGTLFAYALAEETFFFGLSPEHLFRREGLVIHSEAVAGTRPKGDQYREELLHSTKEQEEFSYVADYIEKQLLIHCDEVLSSPLQIKETPTVQHLHKTFSGKAHPTFSDLAFLSSYHPTPALCGTPKEKALSWILHHENYHRGLYGAPLGWFSKNVSEFIVGIRSCLVNKEKSHFFSAAGIVKNSNFLDEWNEIHHKSQLMRKLFYEKHTLLEPSLFT